MPLPRPALAALLLCTLAPAAGAEGVRFPLGEVFRAPIAAPKEPRSHLTWLRLDLGSDRFSVGSVGFGENFGLVRWAGPNPGEGWQLGLSGAVLAQFNLDAPSLDLVNADYTVGFPLSFRRGAWGGRARLYHQSSHLGDEFLLYPQRIGPMERINLSFEVLEVLGAWHRGGLRVLGGPSYVLHTDTPLKRWSLVGGVEYRGQLLGWGTARPFAGALVHSWRETGWDFDVALRAGLEFPSPYGGERSVQFAAEAYQGHLPFGQFYEREARYLGAGITFAF